MLTLAILIPPGIRKEKKEDEEIEKKLHRVLDMRISFIHTERGEREK